MSFTAARIMVGRVVLVVGVLILLLIPYLLWGTGLKTAQSQQALRNELHTALRHADVPRTVAAPSSGSPQLAPPQADPALGSPVGSIDIPKIGLSMVVVEGTGTAQLELGPGHYPGTPLPGEAGNVAIAGHRTTYLHPFYSLGALVPGDAINLTTLQGSFTYHVTGSQTVSPSDVSVVAVTRQPELTLTTCTPPYSASQRLVVHAVLVASVLAHSAGPTSTDATVHLRPVAASSPRSWPAAILLGLAVALVTTTVWMLAVRTRRGRRWTVLGVGTAAWVVAVFFFFQAVAPLLPASY